MPNDTLSFPVGDRTVGACCALPDHDGRGIGVLLLHAWWGLTPFFKGVCDRLGEAGFVALAPDLFHGAMAQTVEEATQLRKGLDRKGAYRELRAAVDQLLAHPAVSQPEIGVVGYSLGAGFALEAARSRPGAVKAVVLYYGMGGGKLDKAQAAFQGHFAAQDRWGADAAKVAKLAARLEAAGRPFTPYTYPGTEHWFFEADRPEAYQPEAAELAWERTISFLRQALG